MVLLFENGFSGQTFLWICHITSGKATCAPAKALQKLSPSRKTTFKLNLNGDLTNKNNMNFELVNWELVKGDLVNSLTYLIEEYNNLNLSTV